MATMEIRCSECDKLLGTKEIEGGKDTVSHGLCPLHALTTRIEYVEKRLEDAPEEDGPRWRRLLRHYTEDLEKLIKTSDF